MSNSYSFVDEVRSSPYYNAFDPYEDLGQFLEEAKHHAQEAGSKLLEPEKEKLVVNKLLQVKDKKSKKLWKASSVISWFKGEKSGAKPSSNLADLTPMNKSVSGPLCSRERSDCTKPKRHLSGPLNSLFTPIKKADTEMQYTSIPKLNGKSSHGPYGPVYTV